MPIQCPSLLFRLMTWRLTPIFFTVFGHRHLVMSTVGDNLRKFNTHAQLQTFPCRMASKSFLYSNASLAKSGAQTLTFKSMTNRSRLQSSLLDLAHFRPLSTAHYTNSPQPANCVRLQLLRQRISTAGATTSAPLLAISRPRFDRFRPYLSRQRSCALLSRPTVKNFKF